MMTKDGWKHPTDLSNEDYIESENNYKFPTKQTIDEDTAWLLGMLVSKGSVTDQYSYHIYTTDSKTRDFIIDKYKFKLYVRKSHTDNRGWNCKESYCLYKTSKELRNKFYNMGLDFVTALGGSASSLGNVGPAFGQLSPVNNFNALPAAGKWWSAFLMLLGRLELFTVLILFTPYFWRTGKF